MLSIIHDSIIQFIRPFSPILFISLIILALTRPGAIQAHHPPPFSVSTQTLPTELTGYELFTADQQENWGYLTFVQWSDDDQGQIKAFQIALATYDQSQANWAIYPEGTAEYMNALPDLPPWLTWLADLESQRDRNTIQSRSGTYDLPGLPWKPDLAWRYNQGPQSAGHLDAFDFGVPTSGVQDDVYFADDGIVIGTNLTCIIVERPSDGLRHFYQHIQTSDIYTFTFGETVAYKQKVGQTTLASGCGGTTTGHHLHFAFYAPFGGPILNPQGFSMNGWDVSGNSLIKEDQVALPNYVDQVLHDATTFSEEFSQETLSPEWFWVRENNINWSLAEKTDYLRIHTQAGTLQTTKTLPENLLLRATMPTRYEVIVHFKADFTDNDQEALLVLYQDDDNYLALSRRFDDQSPNVTLFSLWQEENGETAESFSQSITAELTTTLRLIVTDRLVTASLQNESGEWQPIGSLAIDGLDLYPYLGLTAYNGVQELSTASVPVDFDLIQAQPVETSAVFLPFVTRPLPP